MAEFGEVLFLNFFLIAYGATKLGTELHAVEGSRAEKVLMFYFGALTLGLARCGGAMWWMARRPRAREDGISAVVPVPTWWLLLVVFVGSILLGAVCIDGSRAGSGLWRSGIAMGFVDLVVVAFYMKAGGELHMVDVVARVMQGDLDDRAPALGALIGLGAAAMTGLLVGWMLGDLMRAPRRPPPSPRVKATDVAKWNAPKELPYGMTHDPTDRWLYRWPKDGTGMRERTEPSGTLYVDLTEVTVECFARFVEATAYRTTAERAGGGNSVDAKGRLVALPGSDWRHPMGPASDAMRTPRLPVTQVSFADAEAYCAWAGKRLPTVSEWLRLGVKEARYVWGNNADFAPDRAVFGLKPDAGPLPVGSRDRVNNLDDLAGNVAEWCAWDQPAAGAPPPRADRRPVKGGAWCWPLATLENAWRAELAPDRASVAVGFRCVR